jgi:hypothetical protein
VCVATEWGGNQTYFNLPAIVLVGWDQYSSKYIQKRCGMHACRHAHAGPGGLRLG